MSEAIILAIGILIGWTLRYFRDKKMYNDIDKKINELQSRVDFIKEQTQPRDVFGMTLSDKERQVNEFVKDFFNRND